MESEHNDYSSSKRSKFRFKSKSHSCRDRDRDRNRDRTRSASLTRDDEQLRSHRHRRHHRHHHCRRRRKDKSPDSNANRYAQPSLSPDAAFRESLFDALADDEGAQYWEGVYGQSIHTFERPDGRGELEKMTDEEYASYVRAKMWEKTHEGLLEERERRRRAREKQDEERKRRGKAESEREAFERMIDESLRRGLERKSRKRRVDAWREVWRRYLESWEEMDRLARQAASSGSTPEEDGVAAGGGKMPRLRNLIVWPVESGKRRGITPEAVREFMQNAPPPNSMPGSNQQPSSTSSTPSDFLTALKAERVRWHPDKVQHRYGSLGMEEQLIKSATEVFQILDRMWVEERAKQERQ